MLGVADVLGVLGWLAVASGRLGRFCVRLLGWLGGALGRLGAGFGVAVACVVIPCLRSYACWPCLGSVGGIATMGAALRRVAGVSGVYGRKTPACLLKVQSVHLGGTRVTWGVWGVVDYGLGVVAWGEAFSVGRRVGYVGSQCVLPG